MMFRLGIVIPNKEYGQQAGARIRYRRIESMMKAHSWALSLVPIQDIIDSKHKQPRYDAYIISKCYDARALVLAANLRSHRVVVGCDLFDDYFSQAGDPRFTKFHHWLRALTKDLDFVLCSTNGMREVARGYHPSIPMHVMGDPGPPLNAEHMAAGIAAKLQRARETKELEILWFGIGDNPNFSVGLSDLHAYSDHLSRLRHHQFKVNLTILTNRRSMTPAGLSRLRELPVPYLIHEWSEEAEAEHLERSYACFLPVNAQNFSTVKSLNRAVTALTAGVQVLSAGYPLYERLHEFIYRCPETLAHDVLSGEPRLRPESLHRLRSIFDRLASAEKEASALAEFVCGCLEQKNSTGGSTQPVAKSAIAVVHGVNSTGDIHKFAQRMGALSVSSPFSAMRLNYDIRFDYQEDSKTIATLVSEKTATMLPTNVRAHLVGREQIVERAYARVDDDFLSREGASAPTLHGRVGTLLGNMTEYPVVMDHIHKTMRVLLPTHEVTFSELNKRAWWLEG
jgi:hypothetical protein